MKIRIKKLLKKLAKILKSSINNLVIFGPWKSNEKNSNQINYSGKLKHQKNWENFNSIWFPGDLVEI